MKSFLLIFVALMGLNLTGCAVHTPEGSVVIDPSGIDGHGHGRFCPPGQAKKGNC